MGTIGLDDVLPSAFYFVVLEPRLRIFEIALVKWVYNLTVIATCAFTCYLFLTALPSYIEGISMPARWAIVVAVTRRPSIPAATSAS